MALIFCWVIALFNYCYEVELIKRVFNMRLFENNVDRIDEYAKNSESHYKYLTISAKPEYIAVCEKLDNWFENYPSKEKKEFIQRFRTEKDDQFLSAFYELYLFELLRKMGYEIEVHPKIENSNSRPDFLVKSIDGEEFYIEVVTITGKTRQEIAREKLLNVIDDTINTIRNKDFFLRRRVTSFPKKAIPAIKIKEFLERELKKINPDDCMEIIRQNKIELLPHWEFKYGNFVLELSAIPREIKYRDKINTQLIGIRTDPPKSDNSQKALIESLRTKGNKYVGLNKPFVIAVNIFNGYFDRNFFSNAFFGYQQEFYAQSDLLLNELNKRVAGFWYTNGKSRYTRVCGILAATQLFPWTIGYSDIHFYHNPWAKHSYSGKLNLFTHFIAIDNKYVKIEGSKPIEFLDIPEKWPLSL